MIDDDVELVVLHCGIEILLDDAGKRVDFIDEKQVAALQRGEQARKVAGFFDGRAGSAANPDTERLCEDMRESRLAETGRAGKEHVFQHIAALFRGIHHDHKLVAHLLLTGKLGEGGWP